MTESTRENRLQGQLGLVEDYSLLFAICNEGKESSLGIQRGGFSFVNSILRCAVLSRAMLGRSSLILTFPQS